MGDEQISTFDVAELREYVADHASDHEGECPEDDTCECRYSQRNDAVNRVCRVLPELVADLEVGARVNAGLARALESASIEIAALRADNATGSKHSAAAAREHRRVLDAVQAWALYCFRNHGDDARLYNGLAALGGVLDDGAGWSDCGQVWCDECARLRDEARAMAADGGANDAARAGTGSETGGTEARSGGVGGVSGTDRGV